MLGRSTNPSDRKTESGTVVGSMLVIAILATILAFIQNWILFIFGLKERAIFSFPLSFTGIFLLETVSLWVAYFCVRRIVPRNRELVLAGCAILILGGAELAHPASLFTKLIQHARREHVLQRIREAGNSIEPLNSDQGGTRFALTYTLQFPTTGHYLTYPAYLAQAGNQVFGDYFTKVHPEYYEDSYVFDAGKPYSFTVVFDTQGKPFDFAKGKANIDICDGNDYFMACRSIPIGLEGVPAALAVPAPPGKLEPAVPADNIPDMTEKSIRLRNLVISNTNKSGQPVAVSFEITNEGKTEIPIPGGSFMNVISVSYAWEPVSVSAKMTTVHPGTTAFGDAVAVNDAWLGDIRKSSLAPAESVEVRGEVRPLGPLAPGEYRLHVFLFSRYATGSRTPQEELVQAFSVQP